MSQIRVIERCPALVEKKRLGSLGDAVGNFLTLDPAIADRGEVVGGCPVLGDVIKMNVIAAGLECLERDLSIAIEIDHHSVKVIATAIDGQVASPVLRVALQHHLLAGLQLCNPVGATDHRNIQGAAAEIPVLPVVFRKHR